jgi:MHS family proline/betaine transporter-like MFS transporter
MSQATTYLDSTFGTPDMQRLRRRAIVSCAVGNFVELFDFVIYGLFATQIGANFFPNDDPLTFLIQQTGSPISPSAYIVFGAVISAATLMAIKDPLNAPLD